MSKQFLTATLATLFACSAASLHASSVTLGFDTADDEEGFFTQTANGGPTPDVSQAFIGTEGYLRIENNGGFAQTGQLDVNAAPQGAAINSTIDRALANSGTLSFDFLFRFDDQDTVGDVPLTFLNLLVITQDAQGNGFTQEETPISLPPSFFQPGGEFSGSLTLDIAQGAGSPGNDGIITYGGPSTDAGFVFRNLVIGTNTDAPTPSDLVRTTVLFIDNVTFTAVPEPMSLGLIGSALACAAVRRRRR